MRKIYYFIAAALIFCAAFESEAQIRVKPCGYIVVGPDSIENQVSVKNK